MTQTEVINQIVFTDQLKTWSISKCIEVSDDSIEAEANLISFRNRISIAIDSLQKLSKEKHDFLISH